MLFEKAARLKLRFASPQGNLSAEDLWDLPLTSVRLNAANLNNIAKAISRQLKAESEEDFVNPKSAANDGLQLALDIRQTRDPGPAGRECRSGPGGDSQGNQDKVARGHRAQTGPGARREAARRVAGDGRVALTPVKQPKTSEYLTCKQLAVIFSVREITVREWLRRGRLAGVKIGKAWRIPRAVIEKLSNV
jgi:excisionase family DNA binding protein